MRHGVFWVLWRMPRRLGVRGALNCVEGSLTRCNEEPEVGWVPDPQCPPPRSTTPRRFLRISRAAGPLNNSDHRVPSVIYRTESVACVGPCWEPTRPGLILEPEWSRPRFIMRVPPKTVGQVANLRRGCLPRLPGGRGKALVSLSHSHWRGMNGSRSSRFVSQKPDWARKFI